MTASGFAHRNAFQSTMTRVARIPFEVGSGFPMNAVRRLLLIVSLLLLSGSSGCWHCNCPPKDLFSCIDRNCFVADWMNEHSCLSCRHCANNDPAPIGCRPYTADTDPVPASASK